MSLRLIPILVPFLFAPSARAAAATGGSSSAASTVDHAGFYLGFGLLVVVSAAEAAMSVLWTRIRVTYGDGEHPAEISCRVCGREINIRTIDDATATKIANEGLPAGLHTGTHSSVTYSQGGIVRTHYASATGCSTCGGMERRHVEHYNGATVGVVDKFGSIMMVPTLLIRRFNPTTSLEAPAGLVNNVKIYFSKKESEAEEGAKKRSVGRILEHTVHLIVGLTDVSLGIAGLVLIPGSPQNLYEALKSPTAPMTFENYSTLFLLFWILGAILLVCMIPLRSARRSIQMFGWPGGIVFLVASLASIVLFCLGCWKIDYARRHHLGWTPMLSYWIGGASVISFPVCGIEVFHTFGVVGLVFMLIHTF